DGYEVCRRLKADPLTRDISIIFVTAMDSSESESTGLTLGAEDYITKPVNLGIARLRIRNLLERRRLHRDLELSMAGARQGLWSWDVEADLVTLSPRWAEPLDYA
ncbi:MAG TPA: response regulator, partial [Rhodocyclaceae bacterium]|nr:response regulator [Rhodocyclaceae bacterium]